MNVSHTHVRERKRGEQVRTGGKAVTATICESIRVIDCDLCLRIGVFVRARGDTSYPPPFYSVITRFPLWHKDVELMAEENKHLTEDLKGFFFFRI